MVKTCAAYSCSNKTLKGNGISFHTFPKDPELRKKWIIATKRKDFSPTYDTRLCSMHFSADAYQLRPNASYPLLKTGAVPTIFHFPPHLAPPPPKKRRILVRQQTDKEINKLSKQQSPSDNQLNGVSEEVTTAGTGTSKEIKRISAECQPEYNSVPVKTEALDELNEVESQTFYPFVQIHTDSSEEDGASQSQQSTQAESDLTAESVDVIQSTTYKTLERAKEEPDSNIKSVSSYSFCMTADISVYKPLGEDVEDEDEAFRCLVAAKLFSIRSEKRRRALMENILAIFEEEEKEFLKETTTEPLS